METNQFDFIADERFRKLLERDYEELEKCYDNKALKSVLVLSGSIIEAVLVEYFKSNLPDGTSEKDILRMSLYDLTTLAANGGIISNKIEDLSIVVKDYRNLIHPGREIRKNETIDHESASIAISIVRMVVREIRKNYLDKYGYKAEDIVNKLETDDLSHSIFEKLIAKLNSYEKSKLTDLLTDYDLQSVNHKSAINDISTYLNLLKPLIKKEVIIDQLDKLLQKVETGKSWEVRILYKLYHQDLKLLPSEKREIITLYMLNLFIHDMQYKKEVQEYNDFKVFSTIMDYIETDKQEELFKTFLGELVKNYDGDINEYVPDYFLAFDQILNSLNSDRRENIIEYISKSIPSLYSNAFIEDYNHGNYLPF